MKHCHAPKVHFIFILRWGTVWSQLRNSRNKTKQKVSPSTEENRALVSSDETCLCCIFFFFFKLNKTGLELKLGNVIKVFKISQTNVLHCTATWQLAACVVQKRTAQINPEQHLTRSCWLFPNLSSHLGLFVSGVKHLQLMELDQSHVMEWKNLREKKSQFRE